MTDTIDCLDCGRQLLLPDDRLDQMVQCPSCAREFIVRREHGALRLEDMGRSAHAGVPAPTYRIEGAGAEPQPTVPTRGRPPASESCQATRRTTANLGVVGAAAAVAGVVAFVVVRFQGQAPIDAAEWQRCAPADARASVLMPGVPSTGPFPTPGINGFRHVVQYDGVTSFVFAYGDDPAAADGGAAATNELDRLATEQREVMARGREGEVTSETTIHWGPHPGREIRIRRRGSGEMILCRMFMVTGDKGRRFYLLAASGPRIRPDGTDAVRFFESFELEE